MNMDKIIDKMKINRDEKVRESYTCKRGKYSYNDMSVFADGYSMAIKDLIELYNIATEKCTENKDNQTKFNIGDKVWVKAYATLKEGVYEIEDINEDYALLVGESRYGIALDKLKEILIYNLRSEEKKDKIKPLEYDYEIISGGGRILKETKLKMDEDDIVNKINEIIKYINKED